MMDLRLLGVAFRQTPLSQIQRQLFPWLLATLAVTAATGATLLAGLNALVFDRITSKGLAAWDLSPRPPLGARLAGALSLALWAGVIVLGRFTAYNWLD